MSVPGRIGIILIITLAIVDAVILLSGARHAATAIETHAMVEVAPAVANPGVTGAPRHEPLLSTALRQINLLMSKPMANPTGI